jgi:tetratricopeptide (TPR) repeat protein
VLVGLAPVANLLLPIGTIMAERLLYLPSAGFVLLLADSLLRLRAARGRRTWMVAAVVLLLVHAGRAWTRSADWRDNETLFRAAVDAYPRSAKAHQGLGAALQERGDLIGALESYQRAIAIYPGYDVAHYNLGLVYYELQQYEQALASFQEATRLDPDDPQAWLNAGAACHALGRLEAAEAAYRQALALHPAYAPAWQNLADTYWEMGDSARAAAAHRELLRLQPDHPRRAEYEARERAGNSTP